YKDVAEPKIGPNDVLIKVKAAGCNYNDIWARRGLPGMRVILPHISGSDAAGEVVAIG
ncbi:MAG: alcohol dehydrogenase catalytic domain-containing protein, partial [Anaerolineae bacterium]|nr:alcohol dehydrogenase catalytic domain-containing protein [Anaerolineae bacterium]